jgi:hypothetical protein
MPSKGNFGGSTLSKVMVLLFGQLVVDGKSRGEVEWLGELGIRSKT